MTIRNIKSYFFILGFLFAASNAFSQNPSADDLMRKIKALETEFSGLSIDEFVKKASPDQLDQLTDKYLEYMSLCSQYDEARGTARTKTYLNYYQDTPAAFRALERSELTGKESFSSKDLRDVTLGSIQQSEEYRKERRMGSFSNPVVSKYLDILKTALPAITEKEEQEEKVAKEAKETERAAKRSASDKNENSKDCQAFHTLEKYCKAMIYGKNAEVYLNKEKKLAKRSGQSNPFKIRELTAAQMAAEEEIEMAQKKYRSLAGKILSEKDCGPIKDENDSLWVQSQEMLNKQASVGKQSCGY